MELIVKEDIVLMTSHLSGLNAISHSLSHSSSFDRSVCKVWQSEMVRYIIVSSVILCCFVYFQAWKPISSHGG